eukprot:ctg_2391.g443
MRREENGRGHGGRCRRRHVERTEDDRWARERVGWVQWNAHAMGGREGDPVVETAAGARASRAPTTDPDGALRSSRVAEPLRHGERAVSRGEEVYSRGSFMNANASIPSRNTFPLGRIAVVTGCSGAIGRATARALADRRWNVVGTTRVKNIGTTVPETNLLVQALDAEAVVRGDEWALPLLPVRSA